MAATKSLVSHSSRATLVFALIALVVQTQVMAQPLPAQTCAAQVGNLNVCAPFVLPGATNTNPSPECCTALQAVEHDCLCNTIRISARIPSQCNLPNLSCGVN